MLLLVSCILQELQKTRFTITNFSIERTHFWISDCSFCAFNLYLSNWWLNTELILMCEILKFYFSLYFFSSHLSQSFSRSFTVLGSGVFSASNSSIVLPFRVPLTINSKTPSPPFSCKYSTSHIH